MSKWWPFSKTYDHKCPDGTVKKVYRRVDDAFPLYVQGFEGNISANIEPVQGEIKAEYAERIHGLLYDLDDLNGSLQMDFRGIYVAYQDDPCNDGGYLRRQVEKIIQEQKHLRAEKIRIKGLIELAKIFPDNSEQFLLVFQDIVHQLGGNSVQGAAQLEINETRSVAIAWTKR